MTLQGYDWTRVRIEYVQGRENGGGLERPTLEQLAQEYGIASNTVRSRAARERWTVLRNDYATILQQKTRDKTLEQLAEKASQLDIQAFGVARASLALHARELIEGTQSGDLSLAHRERLLRMCDVAHRIGRRAIGRDNASE